MVIGEGLWGLVESKYNLSLHEGCEGGSGNYRLVSFTLIPVKVIEQILLETIIKCMKDK